MSGSAVAEQRLVRKQFIGAAGPSQTVAHCRMMPLATARGADVARSSEQHAKREQASGNDGMTPKFDDEIPFGPCWQ